MADVREGAVGVVEEGVVGVSVRVVGVGCEAALPPLLPLPKIPHKGGAGAVVVVVVVMVVVVVVVVVVVEVEVVVFK